MKSLAKDYPQIEVRCYENGVDTEHISKYGSVSTSMLIINESEAITDLSKMAIRKAFMKLAASL